MKELLFGVLLKSKANRQILERKMPLSAIKELKSFERLFVRERTSEPQRGPYFIVTYITDNVVIADEIKRN